MSLDLILNPKTPTPEPQAEADPAPVSESITGEPDIEAAKCILKEIFRAGRNDPRFPITSMDHLYKQVAQYVLVTSLYNKLRYDWVLDGQPRRRKDWSAKRLYDSDLPTTAQVNNYKANRVEAYQRTEERLGMDTGDDKLKDAEKAWRKYLMEHADEFRVSSKDINEGIRSFKEALLKKRHTNETDNRGKKRKLQDMLGEYDAAPSGLGAGPGNEGLIQEQMEGECKLQ